VNGDRKEGRNMDEPEARIHAEWYIEEREQGSGGMRRTVYDVKAEGVGGRFFTGTERGGLVTLTHVVKLHNESLKEGRAER
jgi:hypothetical protein